ncbi:D-alanyl-D-alanine carboxypeptidase family protein [Burkholderia vietnamiensis]|nr:D-alanyl-D-alanine carboxypeptidase family protein [Burkholderia vietnamiensis]MDN8035884.1 D-alanyl-D-alanine carboxypeptidase family protein [Burkholderia vietnamiensis]
MRRLHSLLQLPLLLVGATSCLAGVAGNAAAHEPPNVQAVSWMVIDGESEQILAEHDADVERQPASLTKLMTAYIVLRALRNQTLHWDEKVRIGASDVGAVRGDEAKMYLVPGQVVSIKDLIQGLIVASANDAAMVLARHVGGSLSGFEQMMNDTARQLGMRHTHFSTPSGITTPGNYSTVRDLSTLALRLTKDFPEYYGYSSEQHFAYGKFAKRNKNWLLGMDPSVDGLKTGHTKAAGYCIVATAKRRQVEPPMERRVFAIVLGAPTATARISGAGTLLNYAFSSYKDYPTSRESEHHFVTRAVAPN